jgi:hypothetical protein
MLAAPSGSGEASAALQARLAARGEGPYALALRTAAAASIGALDQTITHGVPIELFGEP